MCIVPSLQSQRGSHSSRRAIQTPAHLVWQLQGDLQAHTDTCKCQFWHTVDATIKHNQVSRCIISRLIMDVLCKLSSEDVQHWNTYASEVRIPCGHFTLSWEGISHTDPALHLRDAGTAFDSSQRRNLCCQSPFKKILLYRFEGLKSPVPLK